MPAESALWSISLSIVARMSAFNFRARLNAFLKFESELQQ